MIKEPIYQGILQSDLDFAGFNALNVGGGISGGGGGGAITQLVNGKSYIAVTFDTVQLDANWKFTQLLVANTVDVAPLNLWAGTLTSKSATGFTLQLSSEPDSANYYLHWGFTGTGGGTGSTAVSPLSSGATATELLNAVPMTRTPIASLAPNTGNYFDSQSYDPCILVNPTNSNQLIMFFSGMASPVAAGAQTIGRATASITAPTVWSVSASPVLTPSLAWETGGDGLRADSVLYNPSDGKIYLFYTAKAGTTGVGVASSTDLGLTWTKLGQAITPSGGETNLSQMAVLMEGTTLHGIYSYRNGGVLPALRYASATTANWLSWTKGGVDIYSDPGRYMEFHHLFKVGSTYILCYESGTTTTPYDIRLASSSSPSTGWVRGPVAPFLPKSGVAGTFDQFHTATGHARVINGYWYIVYCGALDHDQPYGTNHWQMGIVPLGT